MAETQRGTPREHALNKSAAGEPDVQPVIQLDTIHKFYETGETRMHALRGINLTVMPGEFLAVMGASGSGKSTLMNIIGCLDRQTSGGYLLEGQAVAQLDRRALAIIRNQRLGFVFQGFNLVPRTTALDNVALPLLYTRTAKPDRDARGRDALAIVGLGDRTRSLPSQLSGGQQQRVAIARALVNRPSLLIADEPTGNLDSRTSVEIMDVLQGLNARGLTIVMVTHERDIAQFAKRIIEIHDGKMRRDEPVVGRLSAAEVLQSLPPPED